MGDYASLVEANRLHDRGKYQEAVAAYLSVGEGDFASTVDYDLANVYARLGELEAASLLYGRAAEAGEATVRRDAAYNEGFALFEKGRYEESWKSFRKALVLARGARDAGAAAFSRDARHNLELAWKAWKKVALVPPTTMAASASGKVEADEAQLRLLKRLETGRWRPGGSSPPEAGPDDY